MQFDLPQDVIERVQQHVALSQGVSAADIIRKALDSLEWQDGEVQAVREGIVAMDHGEVEDVGLFDRDFRSEHDIAPDA